MSIALLQCPKCKAGLIEGAFNQPDVAPCPSCNAPLQIEIFPAFFRRVTPGASGETIMIDGESSCFYHPQKKAVVPCDSCGRFVCALCDCELKGRHLCPACLESGRRKQSIQGMEDVRVLYQRQALVLSLLPLLITGPLAIYVALRHWKSPDSLVSPMRWAMPVALVFGGLQTLLLLYLIVLPFTH